MYSKIKLDNATATALKLANRACSHTVTATNTTIDAFLINTDPFIYNMTLHYTFTKFIGVIIDTRASKCFIAGYGQFLTL